MRIAFWNVNMGVGSRFKRAVFAEWCNWANGLGTPIDVLVLEELSATMTNRIVEEDSGLALRGFVNTLDVNLNESTKCLAALT